MSEVEITELESLEALKVSGVGEPANGTPFLLLKAAAPGSPAAAKSDSAEADDILETMTDEAANAKPSKRSQKAVKPDAAKGSPGVPDAATDTPTEVGHVRDTGTSGQRVAPMTDGTTDDVRLDTRLKGGETPYVIPREGAAEQGTEDAPEDQLGKSVAFAVSSLVEAMERIAVERAEKGDEPWLAMPNPTVPPADADPMDAALAVVARLAYEGVTKSDVEKVGRRLSTKTESALRAARDHLTSVIGDPTPATTSKESDDIMATLTAEEATKAIAASAVEAVRTVLKSERKAAKKAAKLAAKATSNNKGEVSEADERGAVRGRTDADNVAAVKAETAPAKKEKGKDNKVAKELSEIRGLVSKMASRPRSGGPVLDGVARGGFPSTEGRQSDGVVKGAADAEIEKLAKSLDDAMGRTGPEAAHRASELSQQLTLARLRKAHEDGLLMPGSNGWS